MTDPTSYRDFWPHYLAEHARPGNRGLHFAGTALGIGTLFAGGVTGVWWLFVLAPVLAYGLAWIGHFAVERNRPATFRYPLWSLVSDLRMLALWFAGRLTAEMRRHDIADADNASGR